MSTPTQWVNDGDTTTATQIATGTVPGNLSIGGVLTMANTRITGVATPTGGTDATTKTYVDNADATKVYKGGDTMTGSLGLGGNVIYNLGDPQSSDHAATRNYVDNKIQGSTPASATDTGTKGTIKFDSSYIYICTATNTWKRVAIAAW